MAQLVKNQPTNAGDEGSIPGSGRSPGEGNGNPLQCSYLGNLWTEEPGGLQSVGSKRVGHDLATEQQQQQPLSEVRLFVLKFCRRKVAG